MMADLEKRNILFKTQTNNQQAAWTEGEHERHNYSSSLMRVDLERRNLLFKTQTNNQ